MDAGSEELFKDMSNGKNSKPNSKIEVMWTWHQVFMWTKLTPLCFCFQQTNGFWFLFPK
jgi:hypothetical protein